MRALGLQGDTDDETVTGKSQRGKESSLQEHNSMHFFLFSAAAVPSASGPSPEMGKWELRARDQQLFCLAAGRGAAQHTDIFLLPRREWEATLSGALFLGLSIPQLSEGNLCAVVCLPLPDRARSQDNTREMIPAY